MQPPQQRMDGTTIRTSPWKWRNVRRRVARALSLYSSSTRVPRFPADTTASTAVDSDADVGRRDLPVMDVIAALATQPSESKVQGHGARAHRISRRPRRDAKSQISHGSSVPPSPPLRFLCSTTTAIIVTALRFSLRFFCVSRTWPRRRQIENNARAHVTVPRVRGYMHSRILIILAPQIC